MEAPTEKIARVVAEDVAIVPYDARWPETFEGEKQHILSCLSNQLFSVRARLNRSKYPKT